MNEEPEAEPSRNQLRQEAANWFAVMRGPEADTRRPEFEQWLARGALHRRAYNSISGNFALGKFLKEEAPASGNSPGSSTRRQAPQTAGAPRVLAAVVICGLGASAAGVAWHVLDRPSRQALPPISEASETDLEARYATAVGEIHKFALPDGSTVILDTDSLLFASLTPRESSLRLLKGRARFFTGRDAHSMIVRADTTAVRASNAVFDVALPGERRVVVQPLVGHVEVQLPSVPGGPKSVSQTATTPTVAHVDAGARLAVDDGKPVPAAALAVQDGNWPDGVEQFDDVALSTLVTDANRYANKPIRFGQADLGDLKISGTFHLSDTKHLAQQVGRLLDLKVVEEGQAYILKPSATRN